MGPDDALWAAYWAADDEDERKRLGAAIVWHHHGFLVDYAQRNRQYRWTNEQMSDYLHELVVVALERVDGYRPGRGAKFVSYLRPYLSPVKWKVVGRERDVPVGYETARLITEVAAQVARGVTDPEQLAAHLSRLHGKRIGVGRVQRILEQPIVIHGDVTAHGGTDSSTAGEANKWARIADDAVPVDDQAIARIEGTRDADVAGRLAAADLTALELAIVTERLMVSGRPAPVADLAAAHSVSEAEVRATEAALVVRLRELLADLV